MDASLPNYWPGRCFGCSPENPRGLRLTFQRTETGCTARYAVPEEFCGFDGLVHGGVVSALLDEVAAWTLIAHLARMGVTTEMTVRYLKPVPTRTGLRLDGQIVGQDDRTVRVRSALSATDGVLLAEAQSTWRMLPLARLAEIVRLDEATLRGFLDRYA